jgi:hypothetical protein
MEVNASAQFCCERHTRIVLHGVAFLRLALVRYEVNQLVERHTMGHEANYPKYLPSTRPQLVKTRIISRLTDCLQGAAIVFTIWTTASAIREGGLQFTKLVLGFWKRRTVSALHPGLSAVALVLGHDVPRGSILCGRCDHLLWVEVDIGIELSCSPY